MKKNNIAQARTEKELTLKQLEALTGIRDNTISQYETGKREPKMETWEKLAAALDVSVPYLQGISEDKTGWDVWEANTGFSKDVIQAKIDERIANGKSRDSDTTYNKINMAVNDLMGYGDRNVNAINAISFQIRHLDYDKFFIDPEKDTDTLGNSNFKVYKADKNYLYDDANPEIYKEIFDILHEASIKIMNLKTKYNL